MSVKIEGEYPPLTEEDLKSVSFASTETDYIVSVDLGRSTVYVPKGMIAASLPEGQTVGQYLMEKIRNAIETDLELLVFPAAQHKIDAALK